MELLPAELLAAQVLSRLDSRSLGRVACTSRAICRLASADDAWRPLLLEQGITAAGMARWCRAQNEPNPDPLGKRPSLMQLFAFADRYHEALEFEVLSHKSRVRAGGHWSACLEFANPWDVPVWTFFAARTWDADEMVARRSDGARADCTESVQLAGVDGACCAEGFAATSDIGRGEVVLLHLLPACLPRDFGFYASTSYGIPRHPDHIYGVLLPPGAHAERLVSIGEHAGLGYQEEDEQAERFCLEVVQAEDVRINGTLVDVACPYGLASTGGAILPTTRATSTVDFGPAFDWEARKVDKHTEAAATVEPEPNLLAEAVDATVVDDGKAHCWGLDEDSSCVIDCKGATTLSYRVLRRSVAFRSIP